MLERCIDGLKAFLIDHPSQQTVKKLKALRVLVRHLPLTVQEACLIDVVRGDSAFQLI